MKKIILILVMLLILPSIQAYEKDFCNQIYTNIIENINEMGEINYDLNKLEEDTGLSNETIINYIENFDECEKLINKKIPQPDLPMGFLNPSLNSNCILEINKTILAIDLDDSFDFKGFVISDTSCNKMEFWKKFFSYNQISEDTFEVNGIKIWWIVVLSIFLLMITLIGMFIWSIKGDRNIQNYMNRKQ